MVDIHTQSCHFFQNPDAFSKFASSRRGSTGPGALAEAIFWPGSLDRLQGLTVMVFYVRSANRVIIIHLLLQIPSGQKLEAMFTGCQTLSKSVPTTRLFPLSFTYLRVLLHLHCHSSDCLVAALEGIWGWGQRGFFGI